MFCIKNLMILHLQRKTNLKWAAFSEIHVFLVDLCWIEILVAMDFYVSLCSKSDLDLLRIFPTKKKKSKTISSRVDVFNNFTEMDIFCIKSAAIIAVYQIFHLIDYFCLEIVEKIKLKFVRMPQSMKSSYLG